MPWSWARAAAVVVSVAMASPPIVNSLHSTCNEVIDTIPKWTSLSSPPGATTRRAGASRPRSTRRDILAAAQRAVRGAGLRGDHDGRDRRRSRRRAEDRLRRLRDEERRAARALAPAAARRRREPAGRRAPLAPRGARGARPRAPATAERAQLARRQGARGRAARRDPRRGADRSRHRRSCGTGSRPSSTASSGRSSSRCTTRGRWRRASTWRGRPTSCGRSTTPTCGSCCTGGAAGPARSTSSGSPTRPARSCWRRRAAERRSR